MTYNPLAWRTYQNQMMEMDSVTCEKVLWVECVDGCDVGLGSKIKTNVDVTEATGEMVESKRKDGRSRCGRPRGEVER